MKAAFFGNLPAVQAANIEISEKIAAALVFCRPVFGASDSSSFFV